MREMMMRQQRIWRSSKYRLHEMKMTQISEYCDFHCSIPSGGFLYKTRCSGSLPPSHAHVFLSDQWKVACPRIPCLHGHFDQGLRGYSRGCQGRPWAVNRMPQDCRGR